MPRLGSTIASLAAFRAAAPPAPGGPRRLRREENFGANPGALHMLSYAPQNVAPKGALVVVLHGCTQTAEAYAEGAGWLELADRYGFIVLCPEQDRANNPNLCFNWFQPGDIRRGDGEAASIRAMILKTIATHKLDPGRVFITGLSAGGAMANVMLATYPEMFTAGAIIAGLPYGSASSVMEAFKAMSGQISLPATDWGAKVRDAAPAPVAWPRVSIWQGDDDHTVRPQVADAVAAQWVDVHGAQTLTLTETNEAPTPRRRLQTWRSAAGESLVEVYRIRGMGHGVPLSCSGEDACGSAGAFLLDVGLSSSLEIARAWGLTTGKIAKPRPVAAHQPPRPRDRSSDVGEVITSALKAAGLMR